MTIAPTIAAVVILYKPGDDVFGNIASYLNQVQVVFAVDNTEIPAPETAARIRDLPGVGYLPNYANLGVATALNIGAEQAVAAGCDFLLTMDQDSRAESGMVPRMLDCLAGQDLTRLGIIAPFHVTVARRSPPDDMLCREVMTPMTSGSLLNLHAYRIAGRFRDDLFIDFVDNEYCLRLRRLGFKVLRANGALLRHRVGDTRTYGPFIATNHPPLRRYYKTRNRFLVNSLYGREFPGHCMFDRVRMLKEIVSILLFEREKAAKFRMMWRGFLDYRRGRFGKFGEVFHP
jgi:rhamnosyltransferase